jgi:DNA-binding LacI/PurR family transcriptional regulator
MADQESGITPELVRRIADAALVDPRTVRRELRGERVSGKAGQRVRVALAAMGLRPLLGALASQP